MLLNLCELYPNTHKVLLQLSKQKRDIYHHFMNEVDKLKESMTQSGVPKGIDSQENWFQKRPSKKLMPEAPRQQSTKMTIIVENEDGILR